MKTYLGANIALVLGILSIGGGAHGDFETSQVGLVMTVGALAYKSAKKRRLGDAENTKFRFGMELVGLGLIVLSVVALNDIKIGIATHPLSTVVAPLYALIAYGIEYRKHKN